MTVAELYKKMEERIPRTLSCTWDNDGLAVCSDPHREVKKALVTLDVTSDAVSYARAGGFDLIVSHHPLLFCPLKALCAGEAVADRVLALLEGGISAMSFHTRLDAVDGGVNDCLAELAGLSKVEKLYEDGIAIGRIGNLPTPMSIDAFALQIKQALQAPTVRFGGNRQVFRVALVSGSGADQAGLAIAAGADTYLSGELKDRYMSDASETGINYVCAGHFQTEFPICRVLADMIRDIDATVETEVFFSDRIGTV